MCLNCFMTHTVSFHTLSPTLRSGTKVVHIQNLSQKTLDHGQTNVGQCLKKIGPWPKTFGQFHHKIWTLARTLGSWPNKFGQWPTILLGQKILVRGQKNVDYVTWSTFFCPKKSDLGRKTQKRHKQGLFYTYTSRMNPQVIEQTTAPRAALPPSVTHLFPTVTGHVSSVTHKYPIIRKYPMCSYIIRVARVLYTRALKNLKLGGGRVRTFGTCGKGLQSKGEELQTQINTLFGLFGARKRNFQVSELQLHLFQRQGLYGWVN